MPRKHKQALPNKLKLDPIFQIPDGAEDIFVYSRDAADPSDDLFEDVTTEPLDLVDDSDPTDSVTDTDSTQIGVPDSFTIIQQTIRRAPGGQMVVDIVVAIDDVPGAEDYDIQVVKV